MPPRSETHSAVCAAKTERPLKDIGICPGECRICYKDISSKFMSLSRFIKLVLVQEPEIENCSSKHFGSPCVYFGLKETVGTLPWCVSLSSFQRSGFRAYFLPAEKLNCDYNENADRPPSLFFFSLSHSRYPFNPFNSSVTSGGSGLHSSFS